jgi:AcrR family transcriptional regulator
VCQHAQLNPRYFYESFLDLDALLVAVYDRTVDELAAKIMTAMGATDGDPRQQARAAIRATVRFVDDDRRRGRVLYAEGLGNEALNRRRLDTGHTLVDFIDRYAQREGHLAPGETIGRIGAAMLVGGFRELLVAWLDGRINVSRERLVQDATALFLALGDAAGEIAASRGSSR